MAEIRVMPPLAEQRRKLNPGLTFDAAAVYMRKALGCLDGLANAARNNNDNLIEAFRAELAETLTLVASKVNDALDLVEQRRDIDARMVRGIPK